MGVCLTYIGRGEAQTVDDAVDLVLRVRVLLRHPGTLAIEYCTTEIVACAFPDEFVLLVPLRVGRDSLYAKVRTLHLVRGDGTGNICTGVC